MIKDVKRFHSTINTWTKYQWSEEALSPSWSRHGASGLQADSSQRFWNISESTVGIEFGAWVCYPNQHHFEARSHRSIHLDVGPVHYTRHWVDPQDHNLLHLEWIKAVLCMESSLLPLQELGSHRPDFFWFFMANFHPQVVYYSQRGEPLRVCPAWPPYPKLFNLHSDYHYTQPRGGQCNDHNTRFTADVINPCLIW